VDLVAGPVTDAVRWGVLLPTFDPADVYNSAWSHNWGFVPYGKADLDAYALELQFVYSPAGPALFLAHFDAARDSPLKHGEAG
jgi:hypothetical protein